MRHRLTALALSVCALAPSTARAQSRANELGGFYALIYTPAGALPSVARVRSLSDRGSFAVDLRYGRYKFRDGTLAFNNFGVGGPRVLRGVTLGATVAHRSCSSACKGLTMAGVDAAVTLLHHRAAEPGDGDTEVGMQLSAGYGKPETSDFTTQSLAVTSPLTVTLPQAKNGLLALSLIPSLSYGRMVDNDTVRFGARGTYGSTRFMMGAGVGYYRPTGLGVHFGVHRIAIAESSAQSGLGVSWRF